MKRFLLLVVFVLIPLALLWSLVIDPAYPIELDYEFKSKHRIAGIAVEGGKFKKITSRNLGKELNHWLNTIEEIDINWRRPYAMSKSSEESVRSIRAINVKNESFGIGSILYYRPYVIVKTKVGYALWISHDLLDAYSKGIAKIHQDTKLQPQFLEGGWEFVDSLNKLLSDANLSVSERHRLFLDKTGFEGLNSCITNNQIFSIEAEMLLLGAELSMDTPGSVKFRGAIRRADGRYCFFPYIWFDGKQWSIR